MYNGILICDKPQDFTSHDVVAKLRGILRQRRIGHAGTLDPMATGVLVVLLGCATRASDDAAAADKTYIAGLRPGLVTDTQDIWGTQLSHADVRVGRPALEAALAAFRGDIIQTPPMYSAVKIDGKRLYSMARKGVEVERAGRQICVSGLEIVEPEAAGISQSHMQPGDYALRITCSKGTYVRTLCHDIGQALGCGAAMSYLRRVRSGGFALEGALTLAQIEEAHRGGRLARHILPPDSVYSALPAITLGGEGSGRAQHGNYLEHGHIAAGDMPRDGQRVRVYLEDGSFYMTGVGKAAPGGTVIVCDKTFAAKE